MVLFIFSLAILGILSVQVHCKDTSISLRQAVRMKDVVNVTCSGGSFNIHIDLNTLKRVFPQSSEQSIGLADASCSGSLINNLLVFTTLPTTCGTSVKTQGENHVYSNFLTDRIFATGSTMIVRGLRWKIPITCTVPRSDTFSINYKPYTDVRRRRTLKEAVVMFPRMRRVVKGKIQVQQTFPVSIQFYEDEAMTVRMFTSPQKQLGDNLYFRVQLGQVDTGIKLVMSSCYTLPQTTDMPGYRYYLIKNGCVADSNTKILHVTNGHTDIQTQVFKYAGNTNQVFVTCDVETCPIADNSAPCQQTCQSIRQRNIVHHREQSTARIGPIIVNY